MTNNNQVPVVLALFYMSPTTSTPNITFSSLPSLPLPLLTLTLFTFLSLSRLGLWIYDLTTQQLTQTLVPPTQRSSFTSIEYSFSSFFELLQNIAAMILASPEQFKFLALLSLGAVAISTVSYAGWVWWVRGHLVHWERVGVCGHECKGRRKRWGFVRVDDVEEEVGGGNE
jgi:iron-regulated transporter 1